MKINGVEFTKKDMAIGVAILFGFIFIVAPFVLWLECEFFKMLLYVYSALGIM